MQALQTLSFKDSKADNSLFIYHHGSDVAYCLVYVDDLILTSSTSKLLDVLVCKLCDHMTLKDLALCPIFWGLKCLGQK